VLLATDGSASARAAERLALRLGQQLGGTATTVIRSGTREPDAAEQSATAHLEQLVGTVLTPHVLRGPLPEAIRELADEQRADVIIVGARGRNPLRGLLLGSTAEHLLRTSNRPVMLVPDPDGNDRT
jgi:nucleotide-binding universal stress UspA family protein